ncbi:hypothetical protein NUW54_g6716 [Trametes sanguinea]|uniref:Uncharacterized protein n=1 Tax=Trametes sanguinea TaxID=158606 RepID=A0ACC1PU76_9APHY|nr:hypothetical protein NUW54_g6716 [Trametes sanguinea]
MEAYPRDMRPATYAGLLGSDEPRLPVPTPRNPAVDVQIDAVRGLPAEQRVSYYLSLIEELEAARQREHREDTGQARPTVRDRIPTYLDLPQDESRASTPEPVSYVPATPRPSTPPMQPASAYLSPSPPPSVSPRLYSWTAFPTTTLPPPSSPLTNRGARVSVARLTTPSLVAAHRAA